MTWRAALRDLIDAAGADELPDVLGELERARALVLRRFLNGDGEQESDEVQADLTVAEVAAIFGRHVNTVRGWIAQGVLAGYRLNNREWRIPRQAVEDFQRRQRLRDDADTPALGKARSRKLGDWRRHRSAS